MTSTKTRISPAWNTSLGDAVNGEVARVSANLHIHSG